LSFKLFIKIQSRIMPKADAPRRILSQVSPLLASGFWLLATGIWLIIQLSDTSGHPDAVAPDRRDRYVPSHRA